MPELYLRTGKGTRRQFEPTHKRNYYSDENGIIAIPEGPDQETDARTLKIRGYDPVDMPFLIEHGYIKPAPLVEVIAEVRRLEPRSKPKRRTFARKKIVKPVLIRQCEHIKSNGIRCGIIPKKGQKYCWHHVPKKQKAKARKPSGKNKGAPLDLPF